MTMTFSEFIDVHVTLEASRLATVLNKANALSRECSSSYSYKEAAEEELWAEIPDSYETEEDISFCNFMCKDRVTGEVTYSDAANWEDLCEEQDIPPST